MEREHVSDELLVLMDEAIRQTRRSRREVERSMGLKQGYLGSLFRKRIQLKVWHVYAIARAIGVEPLALFLEASPPKDPCGFLEQLAGRGGLKKIAPPELPDPPLSQAEIQEMVRQAVRDELLRLAERGEMDSAEAGEEEPWDLGSPPPDDLDDLED